MAVQLSLKTKGQNDKTPDQNLEIYGEESVFQASLYFLFNDLMNADFVVLSVLQDAFYAHFTVNHVFIYLFIFPGT